MKRATILATAIATTAAMAAFAHGTATGIVKERMDAMMAMSDAVKSVTPMMQGAVPYQAGAVRAAAGIFRAHGGEAMTKLFPEGTGGAPSEAKANIWTDWEAFTKLAGQLALTAEGLALAAENALGMAAEPAPGTMMGGGSAMGGGMMGGGTGMPGGGMMTVEMIAEMPADGAFMLVSQACSACHTRFRAETN